MQNYIKLFSKRFTLARGWFWKYERDCFVETANNWLKVFQSDEPEIEFKLSTRAPKG